MKRRGGGIFSDTEAHTSIRGHFVAPDSIVREIWGKSDTILLIFAGAAAEFALNKAVDWLYFTGKLPADPLGRLFSTVAYAKAIIFSEREAAHDAISHIVNIHQSVEDRRGAAIPDWAYRDVLFMLIDYSIRAFETLERPLTTHERREIFAVFQQVGKRMAIAGLPEHLEEWMERREEHMRDDLQSSELSSDLFRKYQLGLGLLRYIAMRQIQSVLVPDCVRRKLGMRQSELGRILIWMYRKSRMIGLDRVIKTIILPVAYRQRILALDVQSDA